MMTQTVKLRIPRKKSDSIIPKVEFIGASNNNTINKLLCRMMMRIFTEGRDNSYGIVGAT